MWVANEYRVITGIRPLTKVLCCGPMQYGYGLQQERKLLHVLMEQSLTHWSSVQEVVAGHYMVAKYVVH